MRYLALIKKPKIYMSSVVVLGLAIGGCLAVYANQLDEPKKANTVSITGTDGVTQSPVVETEKPQAIETPNDTETPAVAEKPVASNQAEEEIEPEPEPQPEPILSTQAYGDKYLDLSGIQQKCFDKIQSTWPARFTASVRERNVKALKVFASVCHTGIMNSNLGIIAAYGKQGQFFDSEIAQKQW